MSSISPILAATDINELINQALLDLQESGVDFLLNLAAAIAVFFVGRWAAKLLRRIVARVATKAKLDEMLVRFLTNILYTLMLVFVVLASLDRLGINTTSLSAVIAAAGLAVGLALQGSLSNFASGVMIIIFQPFKTGDYVEAAGISGTVEEVQIFHTRLITGDNRLIIVPNSEITSSSITNYSAKPTRRVDMVVSCGYSDDLKAVKQYLEELLAADERILNDPEPLVAVHELGASSVDFVVRPWVKAEDYWSVRRELTQQMKLDFDAKGFSIPFPSQDVYMHNAG